MRHRFRLLAAGALVIVMLFALAESVFADTDGTYNYTVSGATAVIDSYIGPGGAVPVPATLGGAAVTAIGPGAFADRADITSVTIPSSVSSIGYGAFTCSGLTSITIPDGVTGVSDRAFYLCTGLTSITIPSSVTSIGFGSFAGCTSLTNITIPEGVTGIGERAFSGCSGLTSVTIPSSVTSISRYAFRGCSGLTSVTIPSSVTEIPRYAFQDCSGLINITMPDSVTYINDMAFQHCSSLTNVTIPGSVRSIGEDAFNGCSKLKYAVFMGSQCPSVDRSIFSSCAPGFTVWIIEGSTGYSDWWSSVRYADEQGRPLFLVEYYPELGGTIDGATRQTVPRGTDAASVTAVPSTGYHFAGWSDGVTTATRNDTNVIADIEVGAMFDRGGVIQPTLTFTAPSHPAYGSAKVSGYLKDNDGQPLAGKPVEIWCDVEGSGHATVYTDANGMYTRMMAPKSKRTYKAWFAGDDVFSEKDVDRNVLPRVRLTPKTDWSAPKRYTTYTAWGYIEPKHSTADSNKVKIRAYKKGRDGDYHYVKSFTGSYSYYSSTKTKYKVPVKFSPGRWRIRAYHAKDYYNYTTYGAYDYYTVK